MSEENAKVLQELMKLIADSGNIERAKVKIEIDFKPQKPKQDERQEQ